MRVTESKGEHVEMNNIQHSSISADFFVRDHIQKQYIR